MVQKFRSFLRKRGIKSRMFFAFIMLPLGLMILIFLLYYFTSLNIILSKNKQTSQMSVGLTEENIYLNTSKMEEQIIIIKNGTFISNIINHAGNVQYQSDFTKYMETSLYLEERNEIEVYDKQGNLLYDEQIHKSYDIKKLLKEYKLLNIGKNWLYDREHQEILLLNVVMQDNEVAGYIICGFDENVFGSSFMKANGANNMLVIVDKHNRYLFGSKTLKAGIAIDVNRSKVRIDDELYYCESKEITNMDWKVVNLVESDYLLEEFHNFRNMILVYGVAIVIILEIVATFVYHSIYDPLHNILKSMRAIDEDNVITHRVEDEGNDEIHEVATNFNDLLDRVGELIKTVEHEQEQKRVTQFQLLQAQINPHFLFNTLNTLRFLAIMNEDKPVGEGINALAKLLRNTIVDSKEVVHIKEEVENVKNYIIIQKLRYGDLFETVYNVDDDVMDCQILKFLLQPIVENSILHAFEEDKEHQILTIRIQRQAPYLKIEIGDNGKGFITLANEHRNKKLSGIGIVNIKERISLMYGEEYSMDIQSVPHLGTIVTLLLPYIKGDSYV